MGMTSGIRGQKRDIVRRLAAFGPALAVVVACSREARPTVVVPMIPLRGDDALDAGQARDGGDGGAGGGGDAGVVELEPSPPSDAFACRRDVSCRATPTAPKEPTPGSAAGRAAPRLPSPFDRCPLHDDDGRAFSARETRDARLTDPARCCYVAFAGCIR
jgi:hypothetical protein